MIDGAVMEYVKWFIGIVSTGFMVMVVILMFRLNEVNTFQQEVNYQIERNGGITTDVEKELNKYAEVQYGGYVSFSLKDNDNKHSAPGTSFSGFTLVEVVEKPNGSLQWVSRGSDQAKYGTPIKYVLKRNIGQIGDFSLDPVVVGESASRVRGTGNNGRQ